MTDTKQPRYVVQTWSSVQKAWVKADKGEHNELNLAVAAFDQYLKFKYNARIWDREEGCVAELPGVETPPTVYRYVLQFASPSKEVWVRDETYAYSDKEQAFKSARSLRETGQYPGVRIWDKINDEVVDEFKVDDKGKRRVENKHDRVMGELACALDDTFLKPREELLLLQNLKNELEQRMKRAEEYCKEIGQL